MPTLPETAWFELAELAPDWLCEIVSPSTANTDRAVKMPIYVREGVEYLWLVDPDARTLEVYHWQVDGHWLPGDIEGPLGLRLKRSSNWTSPYSLWESRRLAEPVFLDSAAFFIF